MCGRFAQFSYRDTYFEAAGITPEELPFDSDRLAAVQRCARNARDAAESAGRAASF